MRLTASTYSFEAIPLEGTLAICKAMGFKAVDIAGFHQRGRASYEPDDVGAQPQKYADHLKRLLDTYELVAMDFFPQFATNFAIRSLNDPDPAVRQQNTTSFRGIVQFCKLVGMHTVTILPGVDPHMGSVALTPELARWLVERAPGAHVTLDYSHFLLQYIPMERIHTLIPVTGHFHIRQAKPGALQTRYSEGTVDFVDVARRLQAVGYNGAMSIEYVCADWYGANQIDTLTETAATKDALQDTIPV
jgi:sugar phosphate isomerase/epimerase